MAIFLLLTSVAIFAQVKWDGEANDGQWSTPANWVGDMLPAGTDDVLLDNTFVAGNYIVALPGGMSVVTIKTISISPSAGNSIQLILPVSNTALSPAFIVTGPGYGMVLNNGAVFKNSSGASSGTTVDISDSIRINKGGRFIHNSQRSHASNVMVLSKDTGTEQGVFEFDIPAVSTTISVSGRTFGKLLLSAAAAGGTVNYTGAGIQNLYINSDLEIENGVTVSLNLNDSMIVRQDLIQDGGILNLATANRNLVVAVKRHIIQSAAAVITESGSVVPVLLLNGTGNQNITVSGSISNSINVRINNPAGISLLANLSLPYNLDLINGIVNCNSFLLTLLTGCTINADSASNNSFINGPLRKEGLTATPYFLFPVGKGIAQRWVELKNATGNYTVEFFKSDPRIISNTMGLGIHHISSIEHWTIDADASPAPLARVELSFDNVNSGGVTDLSSLLVAQLIGSTWTNEGNTATSGSAGMAGSVTSNILNIFDAAGKYFTLASSDAFQNPLPAKILSFTGKKPGKFIQLNWQTADDWLPGYFEPQESADGNNFITLANVNAVSQTNYYYTGKSRVASRFYRLKITEKDGSFFYSKIITIVNESGSLSIRVLPSVVTNKATLFINAGTAALLQITITDMQGRTLQTTPIRIIPGSNTFTILLSKLSAGIYGLSVTDGKSKIAVTRFVKID